MPDIVINLPWCHDWFSDPHLWKWDRPCKGVVFI